MITIHFVSSSFQFYAVFSPCPHESVFIWKRNFFFTDTASVHAYPMKTINENGTFRKRSPESNFLKKLFLRVGVNRGKRNFSKTLGHTISSNPLRAILETYLRWRAGGRFPFLSFILGLTSNFNACFQANLEFWDVELQTSVKSN